MGAPPAEVELESAPPAPKDKVSDEFEEKNKREKPEEEKIIIKPADLKAKRKKSHLKKRALLTRKTNGVKNLRRARFRTNKRNERKRKSQRKRLSKSNQLTYQNQNWSKSNFLSTKVQLEERRSQ